MSIKYFRFATTKWFLFAIGLVLGSAVLLGIRFFTYKPDTIHYHANFALYINGQQEQFKGPQYYEETENVFSRLGRYSDADRACPYA